MVLKFKHNSWYEFGSKILPGNKYICYGVTIEGNTIKASVSFNSDSQTLIKCENITSIDRIINIKKLTINQVQTKLNNKKIKYLD